jgi:hypothetical protein
LQLIFLKFYFQPEETKMTILTNNKINVLKIGSILSCIAFIFLFGHNARATITLDQTPTTTGVAAEISHPYTSGQAVQTFVPTKNNVNSIVISGRCSLGNYQSFYIAYSLRLGAISIYEGLASSTCQSNGNYDITFPIGVSVIPFSQYDFYLEPTISQWNFYRYYNNPTNDPYTFGILTPNTTGHTFLDAKFYEYYDDASTTRSVIITTPEENLIYKDFPNWQITYSADPSSPTTTTYQLKVNYGTSQYNLNYTDFATVPNLQNVRWALDKFNNLTDSRWFAVAELYKDYVIYASTSLRTFYINSITGSGEYLGGQISTTIISNQYSNPCEGIDTTTFFGGIECGLKKVIDWAITAKATTMDELDNRFNQLKLVFPFNAFFQIADIGEQVIATSTTSMNDTFDVPMIRKTSTSTEYYMIPVLSSSSMPNAIGQSNTTLIRTTLGFLMWLVAMIIIIMSIKIF